MTIEEFTSACSELYFPNPIILTPTTKFRDNDEFDSLVGYAMLALIRAKFSYDMSVAEFLTCNTTLDLYNKANR